MALPKLNDMPMYSVTIPSLKQQVRIRPFVVKEEKILLIAMESQDPKQIANAIIDTIVSCTEDKINPSDLTSYDVEYLFLQIRGKSVGDKTNLLVKCEECEGETEVVVDINDIKIEGEVLPSKIELTDAISIEMRAPSYDQIASNDHILGEGKAMDKIFAVIIQSMDAVLTEDERISFRDISHQEAVEFLESMTSEQFSKIRSYMENQPTVKYNLKFECQHCGHDNERLLEGMQSFF